MNTHFHQMEKLIEEQQATVVLTLEFLRVPAMSAGVYFLPRGAEGWTIAAP